MDIISRATWGARHAAAYKNRDAPLPAPRLYLHHSVTAAPDLLPPFDDDNAAVRRLEEIGQQRFGWGISYSAVVTPVGRAYEGHRIDGLGSHTGGDNTGSRAIVLLGDYDVNHPPPSMIAATAELVAHGHRAGWWPAALTGGHRDAPGASTACPGRHAHALIPEINRQAAVLLGQRGAPMARRTLRLTTPPTRGADVVELQRLLGIVDDGIFGGDTDRAVRTHQAGRRLDVDGVVGSATWAALLTPRPSPVPRLQEPAMPTVDDILNAAITREGPGAEGLTTLRAVAAWSDANLRQLRADIVADLRVATAEARDAADRAHAAATLARDEAYTARQELADLRTELTARPGPGGDPRAFAAAVAADLAARLTG